jgi:hypothetical protein
VRLLALVLLGTWVGVVAGAALAQDPRGGGRSGSSAGGAGGRPAGRGGNAAPTTGERGGESDADAVEARADERVEGGERVKVFRFSGFDISGRLKSPQLLYFLSRVRAEFDRPRLPHRSFVPEIERSTKSKAL